MIYRLAGSQATLIAITLSILVGATGIVTEQLGFLTENLHMNFIPQEVGLEENIAILVAGFGVFLEHRRWLLDRNDSPWYPSLTLFRQKAPSDWTSVIDRVIEYLDSKGP